MSSNLFGDTKPGLWDNFHRPPERNSVLDDIDNIVEKYVKNPKTKEVVKTITAVSKILLPWIAKLATLLAGKGIKHYKKKRKYKLYKKHHKTKGGTMINLDLNKIMDKWPFNRHRRKKDKVIGKKPQFDETMGGFPFAAVLSAMPTILSTIKTGVDLYRYIKHKKHKKKGEGLFIGGNTGKRHPKLVREEGLDEDE
jgi:hypothetical protein